jgi:hypothetical protein
LKRRFQRCFGGRFRGWRGSENKTFGDIDNVVPIIRKGFHYIPPPTYNSAAPTGLSRAAGTL